MSSRDNASLHTTTGDWLRFGAVSVYLSIIALFLVASRRVERPFPLRRLLQPSRYRLGPAVDASAEARRCTRTGGRGPLPDGSQLRPTAERPERNGRGARPEAVETSGLSYGVFRCPETGAALELDGDALVTASGRRWPIVRGIPRFVSSDHYVGSFSFEWNTHSTTQLDSRTGSTSSEEMFQKKTGLTPEQVAGKLVLDAGVGAGRFSDVLCRWGARVVGVDLSYAVEASFRNFKDVSSVLIAQADIGSLPFAPCTFDYVVSIGVLHHTPDTRTYFHKLVPLLKPGGEIAIWVYPDQGNYKRRAAWIPFTRRIPVRWFYSWCKCFVPLAHRHLRSPVVQLISRVFGFSNQGLGIENDILDTFDGYSPWFHGVHSPEEVVRWFEEAGLTDIRTFPWPTAVRGRRPQPIDQAPSV